MLPRRQRRIANCRYRGQRLYFLTILTKRRQRFFEDDRIAGICITQICRAADTTGFSIRAGTVMPDHVHLLVEARTPSAHLIEFAKRAKQLSGYYAKRITGHRLWSDGYYDRIVRHDDDPQRFVDYILRNPVKAGLAPDVGVHPYTWTTTTRVTTSKPDLQVGRSSGDHRDGDG